MAVVGFREWGLVMARRGHGARGAVALWMAALVVAGCGSAPASESGAQPTAHATASEACRAGTGGDWKVAVEVDGPDSSALALVSGDSIATCLTSRNADRTGFGSTAVGVGLHPVGSASALTYVTSMATTSGPPSILIGRVPPVTSAVRLVLADGSEQNATIGGDIWLVWLTTPGEPTLIEALDASGAAISRIEDANGIQPAD